MRSFRRPSPAMVVAIIAVVVATAGTAFAATGQLVNIADGTTATRLAKVGGDGKVFVGDGSGAMTVDGTTSEAVPSTLVHGRAVNTSTCTQVVAPPAGKALVVKSIHLDTYSVPSPGQSSYIGIYTGTSCNSLLMFVNPATLGLTSIPLDGAGVGVPAGQALWAWGNSAGAEVYAMGYTVPSAQVPATAAAATRTRAAQRPGG